MMAPLAIYVDGIKAPGSEVLYSLLAKDVQEVRYLDPTKSQNEYGISASGGALQVKLVQRAVTEAKQEKQKDPPKP